MDLPIRESLGSVVVPDLKAEKQQQHNTPTPPYYCMWILPRAERERPAGSGTKSEEAGMGNGRARAVALGKARGCGGEMGKQEASRKASAATACSYIGASGARGQARAKATGQALASSPPVSAHCSQHASRDYFATAKAGRAVGDPRPPGPGQLWRDARGLPVSPPFRSPS